MCGKWSQTEKKSAHIWTLSKLPWPPPPVFLDTYEELFCKTKKCQKGKFIMSKGEQGTAELGANTVLKQTNELLFYGQKLPSPTVIGQSKWLGSLGLAQQVFT